MAKLLDSINSPADIKRLPSKELKPLAEEIRQEMVQTVQVTGGHLASSLGAVELTIALHRVFDSPVDKIIWDVGHQAYAHKLLTGRRKQFHTLRQYGGLSGFPSRDESVHDSFGTGHASTSISAALGMATARDLSGEHYNVIAVIGDGAIGGGMALEALNNTASSGTRLIVVLNDNGMSISPTVGAIAKLLRRVRFDRRYYKANESGKRILGSLPLGKQATSFGSQLKHSLKTLFIKNTIWEDLGLAYMGPIDGHNIAELESALTQAREYTHKAVLVHIVTTKGKGYGPAENDAVCFHGVAPKGGKAKVAPSYSEVFAQTMQKIMRLDPRVVVITPAMPEGNCLNMVQKEFPNRVFDVGICEQHAVTFAAGLATQDIKPVVAIYSTFLQRSFDQIIHDVCLQKIPVVFAVDRGGIVGDDGKTHQGIFDLSYLSLIPNLAVAAPRDENELQHLLYTAVCCGQPMAVRYPRGNGLGVAMDTELHSIPIGNAEILREGQDLAIIAIGVSVQTAMDAAAILAEKGIETTVINGRFARPLDTSLITGVAQRIKNIVTIEENVLAGGFGSSVITLLEQSCMQDVHARCIGIPDEFVEHGTQAILRAKYALDTRGIVQQIQDFFPELANPKMKSLRH
ncbi:MAG: 1-deoxy-D-xylulose-5-phosphate synthase [Dehalococcoidia bacterium]|nr:MAG: 1-deoxy-D-xylulose-5-phosphate synthase [Dehalococcoidia bacterium]